MAAENIENTGKIKKVVWAVLLLWLGVTFILGANEAFVGKPGALPLPILSAVLIPVLVFLIAFGSVGSFHDYVMSLDLELAAGVQAWRFGGLGFIALYAYGVLPGLFAWPAGLGDMAIGLTAPWVVRGLRRRQDFAAGRLYLVWNLLGILDLVVAVSLGGLSSFVGAIAPFPMAIMPLVLVPAFLVPLFIMLHLASLLQAGRLIAASRTSGWTGSSAQPGPTATGHTA